MKDKKLFGKLNILDILLILALIAAIVFIAWYVSRPAETVGLTELSEPNVRFSVLCRDVTQEVAESAIEALQGEPRTIDGVSVTPRRIFNSNMLLNAEVTDWEIVPREDDTVDLILTVEGALNVTDTLISLGAQEIRVGVSHNVKTIVMEISGRVLSVEMLS